MIDNRDAGASSEAPRGYALADMAADALAVVDHLGLERFHVLGASMGGAIAQHLALAAPQRVASMVLLGTWARTDGFLRAILAPWRALVACVPAELFVLQQMPWVYGPRTLQDPPAELLAWQEQARARGLIKSPGAIQRQIDACLGHDLADVLIMLRTPTSEGEFLAIESNPVAAFFLDQWGFTGMFGFKLASVVLVCGIASMIAATRISTARQLLKVGGMIVLSAVLYSGWMAHNYILH